MSVTTLDLLDVRPLALERPTAVSLAEPRCAAATLLTLCAGAFAVLAAWAWLFRYTGDADSVLHYLNALDTAVSPANGLHPWGRPLYKLPLALFATHGVFAARLFTAFLSTACVWQTVRLAEDLRLPRAPLAGAMLLWQPFAFALAADTMTEMPMALGLVLAVRLWGRGRWVLSGLVAGMLPLIRPEGFFVGVLWGLLAVFGRGTSWRVRLATLGAMTVGLLAWAAACWAWVGDPLWMTKVWSWPLQTYTYYNRGPIYYYLLCWPVYCGGPLFVLFVLGIRPSLHKPVAGAMKLSWAVWALVIGLHSVLFWGGWFCSCGLLRILACTSPFTAIICLQGWNAAATWLGDRGDRKPRTIWTPRRVGAGAAVICTGWLVAQYALDPTHYDGFPMIRCARYVREHHLVGPTTGFFAGNRIVQAEMGFPGGSKNVADLPCDPDGSWRKLAALPVGSVGVWDNRQAPVWHTLTIDQLRRSGFTILHEETADLMTLDVPSDGKDWWPLRFSTHLRYVVMRKDAPSPAKPAAVE